MTDVDDLKKLIDRVRDDAHHLCLNQYHAEAWEDLDAACIAYLTARNLRVIDPAKVLVLERRERDDLTPEDGKEILVDIGSSGRHWIVVDRDRLCPNPGKPFYVLPATEGR